jgi:hypothetical protein
MKKLIMIVTVLLLTITLAGCDFLPDDQEEKVTQELCANDPNHELCDIDNLDQIEEQIVIELVQESLTKINGDGCMDILFAGNESLMETCENNPQDLIPEGVTSLEVLSFKQNNGEYTIYGATNIDGLELEIKISVVEIDGILVFDDFVAHRTIVAANEISEQRIDSFFDIFFENLGNKDISNDAFCLMYYDGEDNDCDGLRDSFLADNVEITGHNLTRTKDYEFRGHVTVLKLHGGTEEVGLEATLVRQEFGPVQISSLVPDTEISDAEAESFFDVFFAAYTDSSISTSTFCDMYYGGDNDACRIGRNSTIGNYATITSKSSLSKKGYDYYKNASVLNVNGETFDINVVLTLSKSGFGSILVTMMDIPTQAFDVIDEVQEKLPLMFANLFDPMLSDSQLLEMYTIENIPDRLMENDEFESIEFLSFNLNQDDTVSTVVRVKFKAGAELSKKVNIAFEEDNEGEMKITYRFIDPDESNPEIDVPYIEAYFRDYFNPDIDDDAFYAMYEGPRGHAGSKKDKKRLSSSSVTINVYEMESKYLVEVTGETESERILWRLEVRVNRWESSIVMDFNDNDGDCNDACASTVTSKEEHIMLFNWFIDDYFNKDITDESFNSMYFNNMMEQNFFDVRKEVQEIKNRYQIIDQVGPTGGAVFIYLLDVGDEMDSNGQIVPVKITKRIDSSSPLLFILDDDDDGDSIPTDDEVMNRLSDFKELTNRQSVAYSAMCAAFTSDNRVDSCAQMISSKIATGYQLTNLIRLQQRPDLLLAEWENAIGEMITEYYFFFPYYNDMGEVIFELIPYLLTEYDRLEMSLEVYIESLNNPLETVNDTCKYVDESSQDECVELKSYLMQSRNYIESHYTYYNEDLQSYVVVMSVYTSNMEFVGQVEYDFLETNPLHQSRGTRAVNPMFESDN